MINLNKKNHPDDLLIEEARMAATSDWEEEFCADIIEKRDRYANFSLSTTQRAKLRQIAGEESLGDGFDR